VDVLGRGRRAPALKACWTARHRCGVRPQWLRGLARLACTLYGVPEVSSIDIDAGGRHRSGQGSAAIGSRARTVSTRENDIDTLCCRLAPLVDTCGASDNTFHRANGHHGIYSASAAEDIATMLMVHPIAVFEALFNCDDRAGDTPAARQLRGMTVSGRVRGRSVHGEGIGHPRCATRWGSRRGHSRPRRLWPALTPRSRRRAAR
jgi:hypothetical protein